MLDELSRTLIMGREEAFNEEDSRFIFLVKNVLKDFEGCTWSEYEGQDWGSTK